MAVTVNISKGIVPEILATINKLNGAIQSIEQYACLDFNILKKLLDEFTGFRKRQAVPVSLDNRFSEIVARLQYIDVLQQKLSHISSTQEGLRGDLLHFSKDPQSALAYRFIVQLNARQFQDAIDLYIETTLRIQRILRGFIQGHAEIFTDILEAKSLYNYNGEILNKASGACRIYFNELLKYQHPAQPTAHQCEDHIRQISQLYTMEAERKVLNEFLTREMGLDAGYDSGADEETISIF